MQGIVFLVVTNGTIPWLRNFKISGIQFANTKCWPVYSNWNRNKNYRYLNDVFSFFKNLYYHNKSSDMKSSKSSSAYLRKFLFKVKTVKL